MSIFQPTEEDQRLFRCLCEIRKRKLISEIQAGSGVDRQTIARALKGTPITRLHYATAVRLISYIKRECREYAKGLDNGQ